ncbi:unnamed protein product [Acanthoscelides obtectus]|uniref:Uncharacterized protein n=1 Tax=Acanthoscelides obtectus TaxID=200917 RepID=A0A9P0NXG3_ACAOB|nr:unnamed protein product [Acanthoscelides obtectus]CAK1647986.1 hypothetical protein AOBTE_LOCUS15489 [Acanthoscelides obtectus]
MKIYCENNIHPNIRRIVETDKSFSPVNLEGQQNQESPNNRSRRIAACAGSLHAGHRRTPSSTKHTDNNPNANAPKTYGWNIPSQKGTNVNQQARSSWWNTGNRNTQKSGNSPGLNERKGNIDNQQSATSNQRPYGWNVPGKTNQNPSSFQNQGTASKNVGGGHNQRNEGLKTVPQSHSGNLETIQLFLANILDKL